MIKVIKLKEKDLQFLIRNLSSKDSKDVLVKAMDDTHIKAKGVYATGRYEVALTSEKSEDILNELTELFTRIGLMENDEPNPTGLHIEELIDIFSSKA